MKDKAEVEIDSDAVFNQGEVLAFPEGNVVMAGHTLTVTETVRDTVNVRTLHMGKRQDMHNNTDLTGQVIKNRLIRYMTDIKDQGVETGIIGFMVSNEFRPSPYFREGELRELRVVNDELGLSKRTIDCKFTGQCVGINGSLFHFATHHSTDPVLVQNTAAEIRYPDIMATIIPIKSPVFDYGIILSIAFKAGQVYRLTESYEGFPAGTKIAIETTTKETGIALFPTGKSMLVPLEILRFDGKL